MLGPWAGPLPALARGARLLKMAILKLVLRVQNCGSCSGPIPGASFFRPRRLGEQGGHGKARPGMLPLGSSQHSVQLAQGRVPGNSRMPVPAFFPIKERLLRKQLLRGRRGHEE